MLDPRGNEGRRSSVLSAGNQDYKGFLMTDQKLPDYAQAVSTKNTVKELLLMKRQAMANEQKWNCSQDNNLEPELIYPKVEPFTCNVSPHLFNPPAPPNPNPTIEFPPAPPQTVEKTPQQTLFPMQYPALQGQPAPTAGVKINLFQWQIQRETQKVGGFSAEQLNTQDADGDTFLHIAVAQGKRALAYVLAAKMAGCGVLDVKEHNGQTALQIAATIDHRLIVQDLLSHGAQINTRDLWGRSPLHVCAEKGHVLSLQSIWRHFAAGGQQVDVEMFNYDGLTALHAAVLSHNAAVKETRKAEDSCSYMVAERVQRRQMLVECIKILLHMGASYGTKDLKSGRTCLHMASEEGNVELLSIFLDQPISLSTVNVKTFSGNTALHIVSSLQNNPTQAEAVKLLMRKGADPGIRNLENELPCQLVSEGLLGEKVRKILKGKLFHA
ncbi:NF-kappa-B inhibitor zeta [Acanthochromis polyacanthus]|uniref:NF-kappa-B inhibitor zeta n=1 Tax=Acanthochromis polyacanthus TaxID=80966 RepID=UPI0022347FB9|nr:NF-kappa-B inhibitor zeta [Acanthochromis polyacanthus]